MRRDEGRSAMHTSEIASRTALTLFAVRQVMEPSASGFLGFAERASSAISEISLMTNPNADDAAMKMRSSGKERSNLTTARSAPKIPAITKRMP